MAGLTLGSSDYTLFDGEQSVVYTQVLSAGNVTVTVPHAVLMGWSRKELPVEGGFIYVVDQEVFLPVTEMAGIIPAEGDFLTDGNSVNWYVQGDIDETAEGIAGTGNVYCVVTRKQR